MIETSPSDPVQIAFVCVQNAGRSQMAYAFAKREQRDREIGDYLAFVTGGTDPASSVHPVVVDAMAEVGIDLSDRGPRLITEPEIEQSDLVITLGCSMEAVCPATWSGPTREWDITDPHGRPLAGVRQSRDDIEHRIHALIDELEVTPYAR